MIEARSGRLICVVVVILTATASTAWWMARSHPAEVEDAGTGDPSRITARPVVPPDATASLPASPVAKSGQSAPEPLVRPQPLEVVVVDIRDQVVADARVEAWEVADPQAAMRQVVEAAAARDLAKLKQTEMVELVARVPHPTWDPPRLTLYTDASGRCTIPDATGDTVLVAEKAGVGSSGVSEVAPDRITLTLRPTARLHGVVRDAEDRPMAGATVHFGIPSSQLQRAGPRPPRPAVTDADGRFETAIDAGASGWACAFIGVSGPASVDVGFTVVAGEDKELDLYFADGVISGRVTWDDEVPVRGCSVTAQLRADHDGRVREDGPRMVIVGADGDFRLDKLRPGARYKIEAHVMAPAGVSAERRDVEPGTSDLLLTLSRKDAAGWTLRGRVADLSTGAPVRVFAVLLTPWFDTYPRGRFSRPWTTQHDTEDGRFEVPRVPVRTTWAVEIQAEGYEPAIFGPIWQDEWTERDFQIGHAGTLTIEVAGPGGQLLAGARVVLLDEVTLDGLDLTKPERDDRTSESGRVSWPRLKPGQRWVMAEHSLGRAGPSRVVVPGGREDVVRCQLVAEPASGEMRVVVRNADDLRLANEEVMLAPQDTARLEDGKVDSSVSRQVTTGALGEAVVEDLPPGLYVVSVVGAHWSRARCVVVPPAGKATLDIHVERP